MNLCGGCGHVKHEPYFCTVHRRCTCHGVLSTKTPALAAVEAIRERLEVVANQWRAAHDPDAHRHEGEIAGLEFALRALGIEP